MTDSHMAGSYKGYWFAWLILLFLTLVMVFIGSPTVLLIGMAIKATIIALWFMHLKYERVDFASIIAVAALVTGVLLFGLIAPDGMAM